MSLVKKRLSVGELKPGMVLGETIYDESGNVLLSKGIELRYAFLERITRMGLETVLVSEVSKPVEIEQAEVSIDPVLEMVNRGIIVSETRQDAVQSVRRFMAELNASAGNANFDKMLLIVNQLVDEILQNDDIAFNLGNLKSVDDYIFEHSVNVCILALMTGIALGVRKVGLIELGIGAILHDIGKILIPQEVLNKPGLLNDEEFDTVKRHARLGYEVLSSIRGISQVSAEVALHHHERFDGNGYPGGLLQEGIPLYSRIVAISDVFDALTSNRVYSKKISPYKAMEYVVSMVGAHFDVKVVRAFSKMVGYYYRGLRMELSTGELAVVIQHQHSRPVVRVLCDASGMELQQVYEIDLLKNPTVQVRSILCPDEYSDSQSSRGKTS